jgi:hypothetical protein
MLGTQEVPCCEIDPRLFCALDIESIGRTRIGTGYLFTEN